MRSPRWKRLVVRLALLAYPRAFRCRFGDEMLDDFLRATSRPPGTLGSLVVNGLAERRAAMVRWTSFPGFTPHLYESTGRHFMFWDTLRTDIRHTRRLAVKTPVFTMLTIGVLALGIGATTAIFAVVNGVLLRPLPYQGPEQLVNVWSNATLEGRDRNVLSPANFVDFKNRNSTLAGLEGYFSFVTPRELDADHGTEITSSMLVTPGLFPLLGRTAALGRTFTDQDPGSVVVLSHGFWQRRFGGDPGIVGRTLTLNGTVSEVVGVMPPDFVFPYAGMLGPSGFARVTQIDMWIPIMMSGPQAAANRMLTQSGELVRNVHWWGAVGRLKPGVTPTQAEADLRAVAAQLELSYPTSNKGWSATVVPTLEQTVGSTRAALWILLAGIAAVLLMAAVNVANMLLARAIARERELATRAALGAPRARLARQLLTESALFAAAGGVAGLLVMGWGIQALLALAPANLPRIDEVVVDGRVLVTAALVTIATGLLVGLLPAFSASGVSPQAALQDQSRGSSGGVRRRQLRSALVVAQIAMAVALTVGAGLLLRSFVRVLEVNPGFEVEHLLTWQMNIPDRFAQPDDSRRTFYRDFFERMEALPGVVSVGGTTRLPLGSTSVTTTVQIDGRDIPIAELPEVQFRRSMHDFFPAMGIPLLKGRDFTTEDGPAAPSVAVINDTMARRLFPGQDPIGQRVRTGPNPGGAWTTIVGVVGDIRHGGLEEEPQPEMYITYQQGPPVSPFIVLRTAGDPAAMIEAVRAEARGIDKDLPLYDIRTMSTLRADSVATRRFMLLLVAAFGALALGLAAIGVYGVMALNVSERTREVGVRLALGAQPAEVLTMVVGHAARLAAVGIALGLLAAWPIAPLLDSQLFGVSAADPVTFVVVPVVLLIVAVLAAAAPARKAMRVDVMDSLRA